MYALVCWCFYLSPLVVTTFRYSDFFPSRSTVSTDIQSSCFFGKAVNIRNLHLRRVMQHFWSEHAFGFRCINCQFICTLLIIYTLIKYNHHSTKTCEGLLLTPTWTPTIGRISTWMTRRTISDPMPGPLWIKAMGTLLYPPHLSWLGRSRLIPSHILFIFYDLQIFRCNDGLWWKSWAGTLPSHQPVWPTRTRSFRMTCPAKMSSLCTSSPSPDFFCLPFKLSVASFTSLTTLTSAPSGSESNSVISRHNGENPPSANWISYDDFAFFKIIFVGKNQCFYWEDTRLKAILVEGLFSKNVPGKNRSIAFDLFFCTCFDPSKIFLFCCIHCFEGSWNYCDCPIACLLIFKNECAPSWMFVQLSWGLERTIFRAPYFRHYVF